MQALYDIAIDETQILASYDVIYCAKKKNVWFKNKGESSELSLNDWKYDFSLKK